MQKDLPVTEVKQKVLGGYFFLETSCTYNDSVVQTVRVTFAYLIY